MNNFTEVTSIEKAYELTKADPLVDLFQNPKTDRQIAANGFTDATILTEAINMDENGNKWIPDYDNYNEDKFEIIWDMRSEAAGGPGFSYLVFTYAYSYSFVGARLVFRDRKRARFAAETFPEVYKKFMTIVK